MQCTYIRFGGKSVIFLTCTGLCKWGLVRPLTEETCSNKSGSYGTLQTEVGNMFGHFWTNVQTNPEHVGNMFKHIFRTIPEHFRNKALLLCFWNVLKFFETHCYLLSKGVKFCSSRAVLEGFRNTAFFQISKKQFEMAPVPSFYNTIGPLFDKTLCLSITFY